MRNKEIKNELDKIKRREEKIERKDLEYETKKYIYDFKQYETIRSFGDNIYTGKFNIDEAEIGQSNLVKNIVEFNNKKNNRR